MIVTSIAILSNIIDLSEQNSWRRISPSEIQDSVAAEKTASFRQC